MPKTLLLADDSVTIQKVVGLSFANEDIVLVTVSNGDDAMTRARELRPDLVLADVVMPGKNGYEVCEALKNDPALRHIPVLLLTGTFEAFDQERARRAGADGHVTKPFEAQALVRTSMELMARSAQAAAPTSQPAAAPAEAASAADPFFAEDFGDDFPAVMDVPAEPLSLDSEADAHELELATVAEDDVNDDTLFGSGEPAGATATGLDAAAAGDDLDDAPVLATAGDDLDDAPAFAADTTDSDQFSPRAVAPQPATIPDLDFDLGFDDAPSQPQRDSEAETLLAAPPPANLFGEDDASGDERRDPGHAQGFDLSFSDLDDPLASARGELHQESAPESDRTTEATATPAGAGFDSPPEPALDTTPAAAFEAPPESAFEAEPVQAPESAFEATPVQAPESAFEAEPAQAPESAFEATPVQSLESEPEAERADASGFQPATGFEAMPGFEPERVPSPEPPAPAAVGADRPPVDLGPMLRERLHDTLEKVAWEAFSDLSDTIVRQALERVEQIAWEVIPQMAEQLIREEIRRMKGDSESS